jgi:hypothetical protein
MNFGNIFIPFAELIFFRGVAKNHQPEMVCQDGSSSFAKKTRLVTVIEDSPITELPTASADRSDCC